MRLNDLRSTIAAMSTLVFLLALPMPCLADIAIVDGADSIDASPSLIVVREKYFDNVDLSQLGILNEVGPASYISPNPPPWGSSAATKVQSLLIRGGGAPNVSLAGTINFSPGVSIVGGVADVAGLWGEGSESQLVKAESIFGVGMDYRRLGLRRYEVGGSGNSQDTFSIDRATNTITFSVATNFASFSDDFHLLISYGLHDGLAQSFDVALTTGDGLNVGADYLGGGQQFNGVPLTIPEPSAIALLTTAALGLLAYASRCRRWPRQSRTMHRSTAASNDV